MHASSARPARRSRSACSSPSSPFARRSFRTRVRPEARHLPLPEFDGRRRRLLSRTPSRTCTRCAASEEHRDHRVRLREVRRGHQRRQVRVLHRQAPALDGAPLSGGAARRPRPIATVVDDLRALQDLWLKSLAELKWIPGETDEQYKARVAKPYEIFSERAIAVRAVLPATKDKAAAPAADKGKKGEAREAAAQDQERDLSARRAPRRCRSRRASLRPRAGRDPRRGRAPGRRPARLSLSPATTRDGRMPSRTRSQRRGALIAEAGTGTGKTFAYLVPALLYGGKVIVSTGTKTLQDQLFQRDLPLVRDALKVPVTLALLKGRANYVCHHHLERTAADGRLPSRDDARHLPKIIAFARASETGDRGALADVPENASIWPLVTSTRDNCLGAECAFHADCFVLKARKAALEADVVVVNHHLFFADVMLRDEGLAELLPACNTLILDEAHQLPDTATLFFGEELTSGQLAELARDAEVAARTGAREVAELPDAAAGIGPAIGKLRLALGRYARQDRAARRRGKGRLHRRARRIDRGARSPRHGARPFRRAQRRHRQLRAARERGRHAARALATPASREGAANDDSRDETAWIRWVDVTQSGWQLNASPLSVADVFGKRGRRIGPRVDLHVGDARRRQGFFAVSARARPGRRRDRMLGVAVRLRAAGAALRAARSAATQFARAHRGRRRRRAARAAGERRSRVPVVHDAARARRRARAARRRARARRARLAAARPGRRLAQRAPRAFPRARQRDPARQRELPRRCRRAGRSAVRRDPRQAAVRAARRSAARGAARAACAPKAATRSSTTSCRRR